jgi:hypothetical protein
MDISGRFHRKKITKSRPLFLTKKNIGVSSGEYGENDTRCKENVRSVCSATRKIAKTSCFSPET